MTDLADRMREHLRERMDAMLECPPMYGSDGEVEAMMLTSLEMLHVVERPDDTTPRFVLDAYLAFARRKFPRSGNRRLSDRLRAVGQAGRLPALLAEFRAEVEARLAPTDPAWFPWPTSDGWWWVYADKHAPLRAVYVDDADGIFVADHPETHAPCHRHELPRARFAPMGDVEPMGPGWDE